jgi:uncharacterized protein YidB (DUF937 family)
MGLLDSVIGSVLGGGQGGGGNGQLLQAVLGMLGNDAAGGGLGGLLQKAQSAGLGEVVGSWISTGQNLPVSADQLQGMLGNEQVSAMAQQLGVNPGDLLGQLSTMLPQVVDQLTPQGQLPEGGLGNVGDLLGQFLKR